MKRNFFRTSVALVLALSLSLVMAVPAAALTEPSVTLSDYSTSATDVVYTIEFDVGAALTRGNSITVTFPEGTTVPGTIANTDITVEDTDDTSPTGHPATVEVDGLAVTMFMTDAVIEAEHMVEVVFLAGAKIDNPSVSGDCHLDVHTNYETPVASAVYTITAVPDSFEVVANLGGPHNTVTAGEAFSVTITALKANEEPETTYTGNHFISFEWWEEGTAPAGNPIIPEFELITFENGVGTSSPANFILTDVETGVKIKATDKAFDPAPVGTSDAITINPGALHSLTIDTGTTDAIAGKAFSDDVTVTAEDACGNTKTDYEGTVTWTSTDPTAKAGAGLPADYTFTGAGTGNDKGVKKFAKADFILKTVLLKAGLPVNTTITVTDAAAVKSESITVTAADATALKVESDVAVLIADGSTATITVSAVDPYGNVDTDITTTDKVTFTASLGDIGDGGQVDFTTGVATNTLTSLDVGTATIKVTHSTQLGDTWPYATTTVELVAIDAVTEVWVDFDYSDADHDGGHDFGTDAFATIPGGITAVAEGGIVNVAAGTYDEAVIIDKELTLKGANFGVSAVTGDRGPESIIDGTGVTGAIVQIADNVILDGFTIVGDFANSGGRFGVQSKIASLPAGEVRNNIIYGSEYPVFADGTSHSSWVISNNRISSGRPPASTGGTAVYLENGGENTLITGNLITAGGITVTGDMVNTTIQNNTISNTNTRGSGVSLAKAADGVIITGNTFSGTLDNGNGVRIWGGATKVSTYAIHQNNFESNFDGSAGYAVLNETEDQVDATSNWWGHDSGPTHALNPDGKGGVVDGYVDYGSWLHAAYAEPVAPVTSYAITLTEDWNLISLPLIPDDPAIAVVLGNIEGNISTGFGVWDYNPVAKWSSNTPLAWGGSLTKVNDGLGYWLYMDNPDTLTVEGVEIQLPPATPPTYTVSEGWNLIGFKSVTPRLAESYLAAIEGKYTMIYCFTDGVFSAVQASASMIPGQGYWVAITEPGTIYP